MSPLSGVRAARLRVARCGPLVSYQDQGRPGRMRFGVPASGPMDRLAHAIALTAVGGAPSSTTIEVSVGGIVVESVPDADNAAVDVSVAGGAFEVTLDGEQLDPWVVTTLRPGQRLALRAGRSGSWATLAFAGDVVASPWLGRTATHAVSGRGGGLLAAGDSIVVASPRTDPSRAGEIPIPAASRVDDPVRIVLGPQEHRFAPEAVDALLNAEWLMTDALDRMGARLVGPKLELASPEALSIPSEPIVRGSIQVDGDGAPTVLHADHQTTGGYPKIATVISSDLDRIAQRRAGDPVRFEAVTPEQAVDIARVWRAEVDRLVDAMGRPGRTLSQRLMLENLVHGADADDSDAAPVTRPQRR